MDTRIRVLNCHPTDDEARTERRDGKEASAGWQRPYRTASLCGSLTTAARGSSGDGDGDWTTGGGAMLEPFRAGSHAHEDWKYLNSPWQRS